MRSPFLPSAVVIHICQQNENVPDTDGDSNEFEVPMGANNEIVKIRLGYVKRLTTRNRHVRQTARNVVRAKRPNVEEIRLK